MTVAALIALVSRLVVAAVFAVAGLSKLADPLGSGRSLQEFGIPAWASRRLALALALVELVVALSLVPTSTAVYGALAAFLLLVLFMTGIAWSLIRGRRPPCHCFGQLSSAPIGPAVLVRNASLALLSMVVIWQASNGSIDGSRAATLAATLLLAFVVAWFGRELLGAGHAPAGGRTKDTDPHEAGPAPMSSLAAGSHAPSFALRSLGGETVSLEGLLTSGRPLVLVFTDPDCGPCASLLPKVAAWQREHASLLTLAVISRGAPEENRSRAGDYGLSNVLLQSRREVASAFGILATPSAVLVTADRRIGGPPAGGQAGIAALVDQTVRNAEAWSALKEVAGAVVTARPNQPLPDVVMSGLDGREVRLSDFRGRRTVVMFWNPSCGYCRQMLGDLKAWDSRPASIRQLMIVVSAGSLPDNEALGLGSPVVIDQEFAVGRLFGARGTPAAVVMDAEGAWDGYTAVGAQHVRALLASTMGDALPAAGVPVRRKTVEDELLADGGMIVYDTARRQVLTLNGTAALIWDCCDGAHSIERIIEEVRDVFPSAIGIEDDTRRLLDRLLREQMIALVDDTVQPSPLQAVAAEPA